MNAVIVTADDFGLSTEVNEAVEEAHRNGILTCASLMVGAAAAEGAVAIARRLPTLKIGLHLVLVEDVPILPAQRIPSLVDSAGRFRRDLVRAGTGMFVSPKTKRQLAAEITAQFEAFRSTGLALDHVNAHKHYHLHPTVASLLFAIGPRYGMRALRIPSEPAAVISAIEPAAATAARAAVALWSNLLGRRARRRDLLVPDQVFGLAWSGAMTGARLRGVLSHAPDGVTEIYTHPATTGGFPGHAPGYSYAEELAGLTAPETRDLVERLALRLCSFSGLGAGTAGLS
ncbi:hopanoid biosynthesis-associated protein HpnK [Labrys okinawensis]|uniref:hopanoid biosynthesis-associated protein HpnK n=1 Tax=Labrys okinawensis TaxID=346911 RepID=UPI0039BD42F3